MTQKMMGVALGFQRSGEAHHACRLTDDQVLDLREAYAQGASRLELAAKYTLSKQHVDKIISLRSRKTARRGGI